MDPRQYDPQMPLPYLELIGTVLGAFRTVISHGDLVNRVGTLRLTDITELPEWRAIAARDPLPIGFLQRVYQFRDAAVGRGVFDAVFRDSKLVNFRAQLFFGGWFGVRSARQFLRATLIPALKGQLGTEERGDSAVGMVERRVLALKGQLGTEERGDQDYCLFLKDRIRAVARYVPGTASVSTYLMDESYAGRSPF
jgi:hypothetical protein